jgi:hypothetical protein
MLRRRAAAVVSMMVGMVLVSPPVGMGGELSRADYVERAESICKSMTAITIPMVKRAEREFKKNEIGIAGRRFIRAARIYDSSRARIQKIPKPPTDAAELTRWLELLKTQTAFLRKTGQALKQGQRAKAQGFQARFVHNGNLANDTVLGFGFDHCLFQ